MSSPLFISSSESLLTRSVLFRYLLEHGLKADGHIDAEAAQNVGDAGSYETFFSETANGKYVPRSIFVDLDPSVRSRDTRR
jgi:tubulin alpha